ncbi:uncharacterized protein LOC142985605 [Anticarsia gemmatalis]|uniref:uncharacterized protein LOC142985605 n=1 Tax=Anticarsia gemmatalis TaxID=129554 RepID=UPI003F764462
MSNWSDLTQGHNGLTPGLIIYDANQSANDSGRNQSWPLGEDAIPIPSYLTAPRDPEVAAFERYLEAMCQKFEIPFPPHVNVLNNAIMIITCNWSSIQVSVDEFHSYKTVIGEVYCQVCRKYLSGRKSIHNVTETHVKNVFKKIDNQFIRRVSPEVNHCLKCNDLVAYNHTHITPNHNKDVPPKKKKTKFNKPKTTYCNICAIDIISHNIESHLKSKKHMQKLKTCPPKDNINDSIDRSHERIMINEGYSKMSKSARKKRNRKANKNKKNAYIPITGAKHDRILPPSDTYVPKKDHIVPSSTFIPNNQPEEHSSDCIEIIDPSSKIVYIISDDETPFLKENDLLKSGPDIPLEKNYQTTKETGLQLTLIQGKNKDYQENNFQGNKKIAYAETSNLDSTCQGKNDLNEKNNTKLQSTNMKTEFVSTIQNSSKCISDIIVISPGGYELCVSEEVFHNYREMDSSVHCQSCMVFISRNTKAHSATIKHINLITQPVDDNFIRKINDVWSHCLACNDMVLTNSQHVQVFHKHIRFTSKQSHKQLHYYSNGPFTYCYVCSFNVKSEGFLEHINSKCHLDVLDVIRGRKGPRDVVNSGENVIRGGILRDYLLKEQNFAVNKQNSGVNVLESGINGPNIGLNTQNSSNSQENLRNNSGNSQNSILNDQNSGKNYPICGKNAQNNSITQNVDTNKGLKRSIDEVDGISSLNCSSSLPSDVCRQSEKVPRNDAGTRCGTYVADVEDVLNFKLYIEQVSKKFGIKFNMLAIKEDSISLVTPQGASVQITVESFHSYTDSHRPVYCQLCETVVTDHTAHEMTDKHVKNISGEVDEHFARKINNAWRHCIVCNEMAFTGYDHAAFSTKHQEIIKRHTIDNNTDVYDTQVINKEHTIGNQLINDRVKDIVNVTQIIELHTINNQFKSNSPEDIVSGSQITNKKHAKDNNSLNNDANSVVYDTQKPGIEVVIDNQIKNNSTKDIVNGTDNKNNRLENSCDIFDEDSTLKDISEIDSDKTEILDYSVIEYSQKVIEKDCQNYQNTNNKRNTENNTLVANKENNSKEIPKIYYQHSNTILQNFNQSLCIDSTLNSQIINIDSLIEEKTTTMNKKMNTINKNLNNILKKYKKVKENLLKSSRSNKKMRLSITKLDLISIMPGNDVDFNKKLNASRRQLRFASKQYYDCLICKEKVKNIDHIIIEHVQSDIHSSNVIKFMTKNKIMERNNRIICELCDSEVQNIIEHVYENVSHVKLKLLNDGVTQSELQHYVYETNSRCVQEIAFKKVYEELLERNKVRQVSKMVFQCDACDKWVMREHEIIHIFSDLHKSYLEKSTAKENIE